MTKLANISRAAQLSRSSSFFYFAFATCFSFQVYARSLIPANNWPKDHRITLTQQTFNGSQKGFLSQESGFEFSGSGFKLGYDGLLANDYFLVSLDYQNFNSNYEADYSENSSAFNGNVIMNSNFSFLGVGFENFKSDQNTLRTKNTLSYWQPKLISGMEFSKNIVSLALGILSPAQIEIKEHTTKSNNKIDGRISSYLIAQWSTKNFDWKMPSFAEFTYDFSDAIDDLSMRPNAPNRVTGIVHWVHDDPVFQFEYAIMRNRYWLARNSPSHVNPYLLIGGRLSLIFSKRIQVHTGFTTDFGGLLNNGGSIQRRFSFQFGLQHES